MIGDALDALREWAASVTAARVGAMLLAIGAVMSHAGAFYAGVKHARGWR